MSDEIKEILESLAKKTSIYKMQINRGTSFNTDEYEASLLLDYITNLQKENDRLNNIIKDIKSQLDYLETYSSKEDVFNDMKRRLDRIENIIKENKYEYTKI